MSTVTLHNVSRRFGEVDALSNVNLSFAEGQITALIGRSGCGKSTLLRLCNGLEAADTGAVTVFDRKLDHNSLLQIRRQIGYAVQGNGLFPHLTARDNITLMARLEAWSPAAIEDRLAQLLRLMQLEQDQVDRFPFELSGGQQQRVGLCRAMMLRPRLLLLDEPFAAIDPLTRAHIHEQLKHLLSLEPVTTLLVTHDMNEALLLADRLVVMDQGRVRHDLSRSDIEQQAAGLSGHQLLLQLLEEEAA